MLSIAEMGDAELTDAYGLQIGYPAGDNTVGRYLRDYGEFSRVAAEFAAVSVQGGSFVDVGANVGAIALPVAQKARSVLAIEANPFVAAILCENVARNGLANVKVLHAAAGNAPGVVDFPTPPPGLDLNYGGVGLRSDYPTTPVQMVRLDDVAPDDTTVVKIDVEGYEAPVLQGAEHLLKAMQAVWIVESPDTPDAREVISMFQCTGYRVYWFFTPFFTPLAPRSGGREPIRGDLNIVAIPPSQAQPGSMTEVDLNKPRPTDVRDFPYLRAFGFASPR